VHEAVRTTCGEGKSPNAFARLVALHKILRKSRTFCANNASTFLRHEVKDSRYGGHGFPPIFVGTGTDVAGPRQLTSQNHDASTIGHKCRPRAMPARVQMVFDAVSTNRPRMIEFDEAYELRYLR
jgi:hypothetical protein